MLNSLAPGDTVALNVPTQSSVICPTSLSITVTFKFAVDGTLFTLQYSFHTGLSVLGCTVDL